MSLSLRMFECINANRCLYPAPEARLHGCWFCDASQPASRAGELCGRGQRVGSAPDLVERLDAAFSHHSVAERLAEPVLTQLTLPAPEPRDRLAPPAAPGSASIEALSKAPVARILPCRGRIHHVLRVPLDHGHDHLESIEDDGL